MEVERAGVPSPTVDLAEEAEEAAGAELKISSAECAPAGLNTAGLSVLSRPHPAPLDTAGLGTGASNEGNKIIKPKAAL